MPRPKKGSPEAKAWAAKMKAKREAAKKADQEQQNLNNQVVRENLNPGLGEEPRETIAHEDYEALKRQVEELKAMFQQPVQHQPSATLSSSGITGTVEKYVVDPNFYPDPTQRLLDEPRLAQFGMRINFEISFQISVDSYETIDKVRMKEPRFTLELLRVVFDEEGNPTNGRYVLSRLILHEDPQAAIIIARERGLQIDDTNEKAFLDEMRYLRFRDWLIEAFYPPRSTAKAEMRDMVVDGRMVQFYETNSEESNSTIPFDKLKTKV